LNAISALFAGIFISPSCAIADAQSNIINRATQRPRAWSDDCLYELIRTPMPLPEPSSPTRTRNQDNFSCQKANSRWTSQLKCRPRLLQCII